MPIMFPGLMLRAASYVFGSVLGKYYSKDKLAELVEIKISSQPPGITVNCSELPDISVWLEITNLSPFDVTIHEVEAEFHLPDRAADFIKICNMDIGSKDERRLLIRTDLNVKQVIYIKKHMSVDTPVLKINAMLSCRLSSFDISDREITTQNVEFKNCDDS